MSFADKEQLVFLFGLQMENTELTPEKLALTKDVNYTEFVGQLAKDMGSMQADLMHMAVGVSGEAGELIDAVKKYWVYGKELDRGNIIEELGDIEFYMAGIRLLLGIPRHDVLLANRAKLAQRYGDSYSDEAAIARRDKEAAPALQIIDMSQAALTPPISDDQVAAVDETGGIETSPYPEVVLVDKYEATPFFGSGDTDGNP